MPQAHAATLEEMPRRLPTVETSVRSHAFDGFQEPWSSWFGRTTRNTVVWSVLVLGLLLLVGILSIGWFIPIAGVALACVGLARLLLGDGSEPLLGTFMVVFGLSALFLGFEMPFWVGRTVDVALGLTITVLALARIAEPTPWTTVDPIDVR